MAHSVRSNSRWMRWAMMLIFALLAAACLSDQDGGAPSPTAPLAEQPSPTPQFPDLTIKSAQLETITPNGEDCSTPVALFQLRIVVANQGSAPAGPFSVRANSNIRRAPDGLQPGESIELTFPYETVRPDIHLDDGGQVTEISEANNTFIELLALPQLPEICLATPTPVSVVQKPLAVLEGHSAAVRAVAFSPDGRLIASGSIDNTMRLWTVEPPGALRVMQGHTFPILALKFNPKGTQLITGSMDGLIRAWQVANSSLVSTMRGHAGWVRTLAISPDGLWMVSGSDDFTVRVWRLTSSSLLETIDEGMTTIQQVAFAPDSRTYAWCEDNGVARLRRVNEDGGRSFQESPVAATSLAFLPDGRLAVGHADGWLRIWNTSDGALEQSLKLGDQPITTLAVSAGGRWLAVGHRDGALRVWDLAALSEASAPAAVLSGSSSAVNSVDFSPLGNLLVSGDEDGILALWAAP